MDLNFNWVDLIILSTFVIFAFEAYGRPLLWEVLDFISFLAAFFLSFLLYKYPANFFEVQFDIPHGLSLVFGFILVWFLSEITFFLLIRLITLKWAIKYSRFRGEGILSMIPAVLRGVIFVSLFLVVLGTFPIQPVIKKSVQESKVGSFLLKNAYQLEQPVKNVFGGVSNDTLTFLTIKPKTDEKVDLGFRTEEFKVNEQIEKEMIDLVNKERTQRGLSALVFDADLQEVARYHSEDMFRRGYFSHYSPENESVADRADKFEVKFLIIGENLAYAPTLELAHQGLMNSQGHRENILSKDFNKIGVGVMDGGVYGLMFTQVFSD